MDLNDIVKKEKCDTSQNYASVFIKNELEPDVIIKTEVNDEELGSTDKNGTAFIDPFKGYSS